MPQMCVRATWVGRESSFGREKHFNLPTLLLEARYLCGSAFCWIDVTCLSEQAALGRFPPWFECKICLGYPLCVRIVWEELVGLKTVQAVWCVDYLTCVAVNSAKLQKYPLDYGTQVFC